MKDEVREKIFELKSQGMTERAIGEKLSVPKSTVHVILSRPEQESSSIVNGGKLSASNKPFPDQESRLLDLLKKWGIDSSAAAVVSYVAATDSFGDGVKLNRALLDSGLTPSKAGTISRHWSFLEGVSPPPPEATAATSIPPRKFSVISGRPVLDPDGEYTFSEALRLIETEGSRQKPSENEEVKSLRSEIAALRDEARKAEITELRRGFDSQLAAVMKGQEEIKNSIGKGSGKNELDIMSETLSSFTSELKGLRADAFNFVIKENPQLISRLFPPRPPAPSLPPEQKKMLTGALSATAGAELAAQAAKKSGSPGQNTEQTPHLSAFRWPDIFYNDSLQGSCCWTGYRLEQISNRAGFTGLGSCPTQNSPNPPPDRCRGCVFERLPIIQGKPTIENEGG